MMTIAAKSYGFKLIYATVYGGYCTYTWTLMTRKIKVTFKNRIYEYI